MQILLGKYNFHNTNHHFIPFSPSVVHKSALISTNLIYEDS